MSADVYIIFVHKAFGWKPDNLITDQERPIALPLITKFPFFSITTHFGHLGYPAIDLLSKQKEQTSRA